MRRVFEKLDFFSKRRVFVCGDLHGEYQKLEEALFDVGFDTSQDVLISVGDLVDRGSDSEVFEHYIKQPWFYRVVGNHDDQPREYLLGYESKENVEHNGGKWFLDKSREEQERIASLLEDAPIALEVITPGGHTIGITHADTGSRWDHLAEQCRDPGLERQLVNRLTGSREVIRTVQYDLKQGVTEFSNEFRVWGIDHVFHGHTPVDDILTVTNRTWIDTGAFDPKGKLTVLDVDHFLNTL
jgi:serine/threonine protein phosphatase 1